MGEIRVLSSSGEAFTDRRQAGRLLAEQLGQYVGRGAVVVGIPRGGVVVAAELAALLQADLDVALTRKLGAPSNPELAIGAVAENGLVVLDEMTAAMVRATPDYIQAVKERELAEIARRAAIYRRDRPAIPLTGRVVLVTDDGVATGSTMLAALMAARAQGPQRLICAVPVAAQDSLPKLARQVDEVICLRAPPLFDAVGRFYLEFAQTSDEEVLGLLAAFSPEKQHEHKGT